MTTPPVLATCNEVSGYCFHECDRFLRYSATPKHLKQEEGVPPYQLDHSLLTKAILNSGFDWEGEVLAITRARVKTVVFLSRSLLEPPLQALDRDDVAEGIALMQGLAADSATLRIDV